MGKIQEVQQEMFKAMKEKDAPRKNALSLLLSSLKAKAKDKCADLTAEEENAIILKEIKQTQESLDSAPADRTDILDECRFKLAVYSEFAPKQMDEGEIRATIQDVLTQLGITAPTVKDKGKVMKTLMPLVNGKADGGMVNRLVGEFLH